VAFAPRVRRGRLARRDDPARRPFRSDVHIYGINGGAEWHGIYDIYGLRMRMTSGKGDRAMQISGIPLTPTPHERLFHFLGVFRVVSAVPGHFSPSFPACGAIACTYSFDGLS
jgi:hypothetical protein